MFVVVGVTIVVDVDFSGVGVCLVVIDEVVDVEVIVVVAELVDSVPWSLSGTVSVFVLLPIVVLVVAAGIVAMVLVILSLTSAFLVTLVLESLTESLTGAAGLEEFLIDAVLLTRSTVCWLIDLVSPWVVAAV